MNRVTPAPPAARPVAPVLGMAWLLVFGTVACVPQPAGRATPAAEDTPPGANVTSASPGARPTPAGPSPTLTFGRPTATPLPTYFAYRVRTGDTLTSIARQFETTPQSIGYWNRDTYPSLDPDSAAYEPNTIRVGWTLRVIPGAEVDEQELTPPPEVSGAPTAG